MRWLWIILTALLIIGLGPLAFGQDYPTRPEWAKNVKDSGAKVD